MRDLLLMFALVAASVSRTLPKDVNTPASGDNERTTSTYNLISFQNNENGSSNSQTFPRLSDSTPFPGFSNKVIIETNKRVAPYFYESGSVVPNVKVKSERQFVYNSVKSNPNLYTTLNKNSSGPSFAGKSDKKFGEVFMTISDTVNGVLGDLLSVRNGSSIFNVGRSLDEVFQILEDGLALIEGSSNASVRFSLWPGVSVEMEPGINGSLSIGIKSDETATDARGISLRKRFSRIFPYLLVPPLIMSAILPFVLPAMKLMAVAVGALNQMALIGAILTIMRNYAFSDRSKKKVIYINEGYKNERYNNHFDDHNTEHLTDGDFNWEQDLKKYEEPYHGSYPHNSYGENVGIAKDTKHLEFAVSDDNGLQKGVGISL